VARYDTSGYSQRFKDSFASLAGDLALAVRAQLAGLIW
jgi:hypothetical protein